MHRSVETPCASDGMADVGGQGEGSKAEEGACSSGDWPVEEQGFGAGVGSLVRAPHGDKTIESANSKGGVALAEWHTCQGT